MAAPVLDRSPFRGTGGPFRGRGPFAGKGTGPFGFNGATAAIDATALQIRAAIRDISKYASSGFTIPGTAGARINASARASVALERQIDGSYSYAPHNLLTYSEDFTNAAWIKGFSATAPSAGTITFAAQANSRVEQYAGFAMVAGQTATFTVDLQADAPMSVNIAASGAQSYTACSVTTAWQTFTVTRTAPGAENAYAIIANVASAAGSVRARRATLSLGTSQVQIPTTSAAVFAPAVSYDSAISNWRTQSEAASTNRVLWCRDLSNAAWTKSSCTAAYTATGIDGVANSASTVTASGANATVLQSITHASTARTLSMFLKRRTGTGTIQTTIDGGTTWVTRTLDGTWQRFETQATLANPNVGIRVVTSGDAVDVDFVQPEDGSVATSPIATFAATATRAADAPVVPVVGVTEGVIVTEGLTYSFAAERTLASLDDGTAANRIQSFIRTDALGMMQVDVATVNQAYADSGTYVLGTLRRQALGFKVNDFAISSGGASPNTDGAGTVPTVTQLSLGHFGAGTQPLMGGLTRIRLFTKKPSNTAIQGLSA